MDLIRESSLFQHLTQQSRKESFEQDREKGIEQGGRERAIEDLQRLKRLHRAAIQVSNLDEFERMLDSTA